MILSEVKREYETNIPDAPQTFKIKTTGKAFKVLTTNLYKNKIRAIVRELACNAVDAHVDAKNPEPFIVHVPNSLEPYFSIKDFGTGLSEKDVMNLYTTFFDSNKTHSNEFIGALGLGSKSPFSYTDSFNVFSRFNGKLISYTCFLNDTFEPQIMKVNETDTDEKNGLEVSFNVAKENFSEFINETVGVLSWFETKPTVKGKSGLVIPTIESQFKLKGNNWIAKANGLSYTVILQGNIAYPLDNNAVLYSKKHQGNPKFEFITRSQFVIKVPIGTVETTPSREELSVDDRSIDKIVAVCEKVYDEFVASILARTNTMTTDFEKIKLIISVINEMRLRDEVKASLLEAFPQYKFDNLGRVIIPGNLVVQSGTMTGDIIKAKVKLNSFNTKNKNLKAEKLSFTKDGFILGLSTVFFLLDEKVITGRNKIKKYLQENPETAKNPIVIFDNALTATVVLKAMGDAPCFRVSALADLPKTEKGKVIRESSVRTKVRTYTIKADFQCKIEESFVDLCDLSPVKVYVTIGARDCFDPNRLIAVLKMNKYHTVYGRDFCVYVFHNSILGSKKFQRHTRKITVNEYIEKETKKLTSAKMEIYEAVVFNNMVNSSFRPVYSGDIKQLYAKLPSDSPARELLQGHIDYYNDYDKYRKVISENRVGLDVLSDAAARDDTSRKALLKKYVFKSLNERYPMLEEAPDYKLLRGEKKFLDYIKLVDESLS